MLEYETFGEPVNQWLTLKVLNSSEKSIEQCYGRIVAFAPLHRGYPAKQQTPQGGERLVWLVSSGDLRHYVTIEPQSSQNLAVLHREDGGTGSMFSIPTEPPAFVRLSPMDGYQMSIEFGREDTLEQLGKYLVIIRRDGDDVRLELQETEGDTLPLTTF